MPEDIFSNAWIVGLVIGTIISVVLETILYEFLPDKPKEVLRYWRKKIIKSIRATKINVELVVKTDHLNNQNIDCTKMINDLSKELNNLGFIPSKRDYSLSTDLQVGKSIIHTTMNIIPTITDGNEVVDLVECRLIHECGYIKFDSDVRELREAQLKMESIIRKISNGFQEQISLICHLNSLYELTNVLSDAKIGMLSSSLEEGKVRFDLADNILTIYSKEINAEILSFLRRMVTVYF